MIYLCLGLRHLEMLGLFVGLSALCCKYRIVSQQPPTSISTIDQHRILPPLKVHAAVNKIYSSRSGINAQSICKAKRDSAEEASCFAGPTTINPKYASAMYKSHVTRLNLMPIGLPRKGSKVVLVETSHIFRGRLIKPDTNLKFR